MMKKFFMALALVIICSAASFAQKATVYQAQLKSIGEQIVANDQKQADLEQIIAATKETQKVQEEELARKQAERLAKQQQQANIAMGAVQSLSAVSAISNSFTALFDNFDKGQATFSNVLGSLTGIGMMLPMLRTGLVKLAEGFKLVGIAQKLTMG
jgi:biopolymer transport protein ExbB/TolQ